MKNSGFGLVEVLVATSIVAVFIVILAAVNTLYLKISFGQNSSIAAAFLAEEGLEAARFMRDESWSANIATSTSGVEYYLSFSGSAWRTSLTPEPVGIFDRRIIFEDVYRDSADNIVSSGGTLDPNTKLVTSKVSWIERGATSTKAVSGYITNLFVN